MHETNNFKTTKLHHKRTSNTSPEGLKPKYYFILYQLGNKIKHKIFLRTKGLIFMFSSRLCVPSQTCMVCFCRKTRPKDIILQADDDMLISGETKLSACRELSPAYAKHCRCTLWLIRKMICSTEKKNHFFSSGSYKTNKYTVGKI
jgi:hypothetical protein